MLTIEVGNLEIQDFKMAARSGLCSHGHTVLSGPSRTCRFLKARCIMRTVEQNRVRNQKYMRTHRVEIRKQKKEYYRKHSEEIKRRTRNWVKKHHEEVQKYHQQYRKTHVKEKRDHHLRYHYGITQSDFDKAIKAQGFKCAICGKRKQLCVDHDPNTGKIRGLLCQYCNVGIGSFRDNPNLCRKASEYLLKHLEK